MIVQAANFVSQVNSTKVLSGKLLVLFAVMNNGPSSFWILRDEVPE
jgi:hypothetical protein